MENYKVIIRPLITEKGMHFANATGAYPFQVHHRANKAEVKQAIEKIYNVKVQRVRTANRKGKRRRKGRNYGVTPSWKKAVVYLQSDYHIDLF